MAIDGTYDITIATPMGDRRATLTLLADDGRLSGKLSNEQGEQEWDGGVIDGSEVSWSNNFSGAMGTIQLDFAGSIDGDELSGTVQFGGFGSGTFAGKRI